jgi:hypothetical protein
LTQSGLNDFIDGFLENIETFENIKQTYSNNKKICEVTNSILRIINPQQKETFVNINNSNKTKDLIEDFPSNHNNENLLGNFKDSKTSHNEIKTENNSKILCETNNSNKIFEIFSQSGDSFVNRDNCNQLINSTKDAIFQEQQNGTKSQQFSFVKKTNNNVNKSVENQKDVAFNKVNSKSGNLVDVFTELNIKSSDEVTVSSQGSTSGSHENTKTFGFIRSKNPSTTVENIIPSINYHNTQNPIPTVDLTKSTFFLTRIQC